MEIGIRDTERRGKVEETEEMERTRENEDGEDGADGKGARGRRSEFEGSPRRRGSHLSGFSRTRDPYPISFPRQFPSVNSIIYRYTPHPRSSTSAALLPSPLRLSSGSSSSSSSSSSFSSSSHISTRYSTRSKQEPGTRDHYALADF